MAMLNSVGHMFSRDAISSKLATAYITVGGERRLLFQAKKLEATIEKIKKEVSILGQTMSGHKSVGAKGTGTLTIYKNTALFDDMMMKYLAEGIDTYFDLQIINEDNTSRAGRRTTILTMCNIDKIVAANFDADSDWLMEEIPFTFENIKIAENFKDFDSTAE